MKTLFLKIAVILCFVTGGRLFAADRYWVHPTFYENFFSTPLALADWQLIEDDGTGGFASSGTGTAILTMDDAGGGFANRLFNINGGAPRLMPFDGVNGRVELLVKSITGGNQRTFLQAQEFDGLGTYLGQVDIIPAQSATGFFSVELSTITWDPSTVQLRFIIGGENFSGVQGTAEFDYFSYSNTADNWSNPSNWSTTSNGPGGASVPGPGDNAIFDGAGNNNGSCRLDMNINVNFLSVNAGFSGNIDLQNYAVTIGGSGVNLAGGGITGSAQNIQVSGSVTISGGAFKNPSGSTFIGGDVNISGGILNFDSGTVVLNGTVDQNFTSSVIVPVNNFVVNKTSGAVNFASDILVADSLVLTQGVLNMNANAVHLGTSGASPGTLVTTTGLINGNLIRWIGPATSGNLLFPLGSAAATAPLTIQIVSPPSTSGTIMASYNDPGAGFTAASFFDNTVLISQVSNANWHLQTTGIGDGAYSLSLSDNNLGSISSLSNLDLTLANGVVGTYQPATGTLSNPSFSRNGLTAANLGNTFFAGISATPLPVTWLSFTVARQESNFTWNWSLGEEENVACYLPQYSVDGIHFTSAGKITALTTDHVYTYSTSLIQTGLLYFRVQETDLDGRNSYSPIKTMSNSLVTPFSIYPNPAVSELTIRWPYDDAQAVHTVITDDQGRWCINRKDPYSATIVISVKGLPAGSYYIECYDDKGRLCSTGRFLKL